MKKRPSPSKPLVDKRHKRDVDATDSWEESSDDGTVDLTQDPCNNPTEDQDIENSIMGWPDEGNVPIDEKNFELHPKQQKAIDLVDQGENIFLTGPGGTGKSVVLRKIIENLANKYNDYEWAAVASTGIAAVPIGGQTLHKFAGCGVPVMKADFGRCWDKRDEWRRLKVLVIEEISMISGEFLDHISDIVTRIREDTSKSLTNEKGEGKEPFGGIQIILCGDFLQLPPISKSIKEIKSMKAANSRELFCNRGFAFQSKAWRDANLKAVELDHIFRQDNLTFQAVLADIRKGVVTKEGEAFLKKCDRPLPETSSGIKATILYPKNKDVTKENLKELSTVPGPAHRFKARDSVHVDSHIPGYRHHEAEELLWSDNFFDNCIAETELQLKVNAQVMLIKNEQDTLPLSGGGPQQPLVNGSRGVVIGFAKITQSNEYGDDDFEIVEEGKITSDEDDLFPVVKFRCGRTKVMQYESFPSRQPGLGVCLREAIPLKLAWAVTIHKSQGMTLDYVKVDIREVFTEAQTYVALSRVRDESGLQLIGFSASKVTAEKRAVAFYENVNAHFPTWSEGWTSAKEAMKIDSAAQSLIATSVPTPETGCLDGVSFVFTGEPIHISRKGAEKLVKDCGAFVRSAVSGKTNYVVIGNAMEDGRDVTTGVKYKKAKQIIAGKNKSNLKILNELDLFALVREQSK